MNTTETFATRQDALSALKIVGLAKTYEPYGLRRDGVDYYMVRPLTVNTAPVKVRRFKRKGPVGIVRKFVKENPTMARADAINALVAMGINRTTAGVQFGKAKKA
jgi:hypothetical protein